MAEKPNQNSNKLSFKDFYTAEYRPGEDESINYRAYRRKRTDEGIIKTAVNTIAKKVKNKTEDPNTLRRLTHKAASAVASATESAAVDHKFGRSSAGIAYAPNPLVLKDIVKMGKEEKSTSKFMNKVYNKHGKEYYNHKDVQKHFQKHAEMNESVNEVSAKKLSSYIKGSSKDLGHTDYVRGLTKGQEMMGLKRPEDPDAKRKSQNRLVGITRAADKLKRKMKNANESINEAEGQIVPRDKDGKLKEKPGYQIKLGPGGYKYRKPTPNQGSSGHGMSGRPHGPGLTSTREESKYTLDDILDILGERYVAKSIANKRKASIRMKVGKVKHKAAVGKRRAARRMATQKVLKRRSRRQEWRNAFNKLAKGKKKKDMSIAQVRSIEKKLERPVWQRIVNRESVIGVKDKRRREIARKKGTWKK